MIMTLIIMKYLASPALLSILFATLIVSTANAGNYPILTQYRDAAQALVTATESAQTQADLLVLQDGTRELMSLGAEIVKLYGEKNPACTEQFTVFLAEMPQMETMTLDQAKRRYHDGLGLPAAPRHCYFGRSQVIHPALNLIRIRNSYTDRLRSQVSADFEEVIEHLERIEQNLDNPPN